MKKIILGLGILAISLSSCESDDTVEEFTAQECRTRAESITKKVDALTLEIENGSVSNEYALETLDGYIHELTELDKNCR